MAWQALFGERATTKIVGLFERRENVVAAMDALKSDVGLDASQLRLIAPHETGYGVNLEPEIHGIARTAVRAHVILGAVGLAAGIVAWLVLYAFGWNLLHSSPGLSLIPFVFFPTVAGMLLGGLVTARPDQSLLIAHVRKAVDEGKWALVVHPVTPRQCDDSEILLKASSTQVWRSV